MLRNFVLNIEKRTQWNHHPNIPGSFRMLIVGASRSGKTALLLSMLIEPDFLDYNNLIIFTTSDKQQEFQFLLHGFSNGLTKPTLTKIALNQESFQNMTIPEIMRKTSRLNPESSSIAITLSKKVNEIIHPDQLDKNKKNLVVFDDCVKDINQTIMEAYFTKGSQANCNCIYLSQSYFDLPRMIRLNSNFLILFKLSQRNRSDIYRDIVGTIMSKDKFNISAENIWSQKFKYIVINRNDNLIYDDVFKTPNIEEDEEDFTIPSSTKINDSKIMLRSNPTVGSNKEHLQQADSLNKQRHILKQNLQSQNLMDKGISEQAAKIQEPTIKSLELVKKAVEETKSSTNSMNNNSVNPTIKPLNSIPYKQVSYGLIKTERLIRSSSGEKVNIWKIKSTSRANVGNWVVLLNADGREYVYDLGDNKIQLTDGLKEILFNGAVKKNLIRPDDVVNYEDMLKASGLGSSYASTKYFKDLQNIQNGPIVEEIPDAVAPRMGEGIACKTKVVTVSSTPEELLAELTGLLEATMNGNDNTFNATNAILKKMLKRKLIKSKDYRKILKVYFHV